MSCLAVIGNHVRISSKWKTRGTMQESITVSIIVSQSASQQQHPSRKIALTLLLDMKTLSRMTGKDFSGPVPEIRVPPSLPMVPPSEARPAETDDIPSSSRTVKKRSRSKSQGIAESGVVVIGEAENFES